jgi:hypothetical protein
VQGIRTVPASYGTESSRSKRRVSPSVGFAAPIGLSLSTKGARVAGSGEIITALIRQDQASPRFANA